MTTELVIDDEALEDLIEFLEYHEEDIADRINDFGDLKAIFIEIMTREPEGSY